MGLAASKASKKKKKKDNNNNNIKGKKDKKKKPGLKKWKGSKQLLNGVDHEGKEGEEEGDLIDMDVKPEVLRKKISKLVKSFGEKREKLKPNVKALLSERRALQAKLEDERLKLMNFITQKSLLEEERNQLMKVCWNEDADRLYQCLEKRDIQEVVVICASRTKWQLIEIGNIFQEKYHDTLQSRLVTENQHIVGKLFTGSLTYLIKLLVYRIMPQQERDAAFIRDFTAGMSIQPENLMEIVMMRSNAELKDALRWFADEYGFELKSILTKHSYKNFRDFLAKVLECERDEFNEPFDEDTATELAEEVYKAGAGRTIGIDASVFIKIFANINKEQFESLNEKYKGKSLLKDIDSKLGGDFAKAVKIRCTDKYEYLASRLASTLRSRFSTADRDLICRIFGCCARWEAPRIRDAYDKGGFGRTLEAALKAHCSSEPNFLRALTILISGDLSNSPLGSDREQGEDEAEATRAGRRARLAAVEKYSKKSMVTKGNEILKQKKGGAGLLFGDPEDEEIPNFEMLPAYRSNDVVDLTVGLKKIEDAIDIIDNFKETLADEIHSLKESYLSIVSHCYESETWIAILKNHVKSLKAFQIRRAQST